MRFAAIALFLLLGLFSAPTVGQIPSLLLKQLREIKLLESNREEVQHALLGYDLGDADDYEQEFSTASIEITVYYASGKCTEDAEDDFNFSEMWKVREWTAVRIEVEFDDTVTFSDLGVDPTAFKKEQKYKNDPDALVYHDKASGMAFYSDGDEVEKIMIFPGSSQAKKLCENSLIEKEFYVAKTWFTKSRPSDRSYDENGPASVYEVTLSSVEASATLGTTISVKTEALDPENDVLTYNYHVTAGRIVGTGAKVIWDLTGVPAGSYSITAGVDDGCGLCGKTVTKTITVK